MAAVKRKTLHDYFAQEEASSPKKVHSAQTASSAPSAPLEKLLHIPKGLSIIDQFVSPEEEATILSFLDTQEWRTDLSRRTIHFGGTYCVMAPKDSSPQTKKQIEQTIITAAKMPVELHFLVQRMVDRDLYKDEARPEYCIVNEYTPGLGISAHVENFRFGEPVCSLTLAGSDEMRFHQLEEAHDGSVRSGKAASAPRTGRRQDVAMARRSLLVLRGEARYSWQHEIVRGRTRTRPPGWKRVSLTFRVQGG
ncbi:hypothetical protein K461DRAFT_293674 [Myriangium duriaei CBS 260.36]|uniref:Fe2OG dioxygenase domain-containing protein n=1 Tax=Myriangium duriaei CBS 260.36 TaxID=1168546 RepID=A0A9P4J6T5_9PEZI|nr:hypothetical protein K461DRAFT_293674 [Myriangium duriaei CBS 260.36]